MPPVNLSTAGDWHWLPANATCQSVDCRWLAPTACWCHLSNCRLPVTTLVCRKMCAVECENDSTANVLLHYQCNCYCHASHDIQFFFFNGWLSSYALILPRSMRILIDSADWTQQTVPTPYHCRSPEWPVTASMWGRTGNQSTFPRKM